MKKHILKLLIIPTMIFSVSCDSNNDSQNLSDLQEKYSEMEFSDCDEFIAAGEEIMEVYFITIDRALEGDKKAKKDLEDFDEFYKRFNKHANKFVTECPDKFNEFDKKDKDKMNEYLEKIMSVYGEGDYFNSDWTKQWDNIDDNQKGTEISESEWLELEESLEKELDEATAQ